MHQLWHTITDGNGYLCDETTLERLEGLAPRWSLRDRATIEALFTSGQIFFRVSSPAVRAQILQRTLAINGFILTFRTFFKHVKLLGPAMLQLRELFPSSELVTTRALFEPAARRPRSIRDILLQSYFRGSGSTTDRCILQHSDQEDSYVVTSNPGLYSYWQLCLFLLRNYKENWRPLKKKEKSEQQVLEHPDWLIALAHVAHKLGFQSEKIEALSQQDAELSLIRIHMREEKPSSEYSVSPDDFDLQARFRQQGQTIFKPRPSLPSPMMTCDDDTSRGRIKSHHGLFLPTIWSALSQEARFALTDFGTLLLSLVAFYGEFTPSHTSSTPIERPHPTNPNVFTQPLLARDEPIAGTLTPRCSSTYSLPDALDAPDAPDTANIMSRSSNIYSIPVHPALMEELFPRSQSRSITFWHLPASRLMRPTIDHRCEATREEIAKVVKSISVKNVGSLFMLVDRDNRLKLCAPSQILHRRKRSTKPNDVYYTYSNENGRIWIMKQLGKIHRS